MSIPSQELSETLAGVVAAVGPSVVRVEGRVRRPASGVVWAPDRVVTAWHVVAQDGEVVVAVGDRVLQAKVRGKDPSRDLALLEVEGGGLAPAAFDDGAALRVGHLVLHLARPGEAVRATAGIVSVRGEKTWRTPAGGTVERFLASDAAHLPGFSGGPLVGLDGRVLGLTTSGLTRGQPLAIPTGTLRAVVPQLEARGGPRASWLGLSMQPLQLPPAVRDATGEEVGLLVLSVEKGGPAEAAGIAYGDTLLHLGNAQVRTLEDLYAYLREDHVGEAVEARLWRSGAVQTLRVTLGERPAARDR